MKWDFDKWKLYSKYDFIQFNKRQKIKKIAHTYIYMASKVLKIYFSEGTRIVIKEASPNYQDVHKHSYFINLILKKLFFFECTTSFCFNITPL